MASPKADRNGPSTTPFATGVVNCPITISRKPAADADQYLEKPAIPRASIAASAEVPYGQEACAREQSDYTVLQQHVLFWDRDDDGMITPFDTYVGFRDLGFNILFSIMAGVFINLGFSYPTRLRYSWIPDPFFRIYVGGIHKAKHGSDTDVYDHEGRFVPQNFEDIFAKFSSAQDGTLTLSDLFTLIHADRDVADPFGWVAAIFEFGTTYLLIQRDGKVYKEDLRRVYDGSLFWEVRERRRSEKGWDQGFGIGGDGFVGSHKYNVN